MNVLLFGATGMVGQGVLRECLLDPGVERVRTVGRAPTGVQHPKLTEIVRADLMSYGPIEADLTGFDACFFCLGVSSAGMNEADSTERGRMMWARVKGRTENALPLLRKTMPGLILTTDQLGRAMLVAARHGAPMKVLESRDISALAPAE